MTTPTLRFAAACGVIAIVSFSVGASHAQDTGGMKNEVSIVVKDGIRVITSNGIPNHSTGAFPNAGNPNRITAQQYTFRMPATPAAADRTSPNGMRAFGVAINGVPFDPGTAELWNNDNAWHYEALTGFIVANRRGLGVDDSLAHVQPNGAYHYHGLPFGLLNQLDYKNKMALIGYAADGFPMYGPYGFTKADDAKSPLKLLKSSYRVKGGSRPDGPGGAYDGSFSQDFEYVPGLGDLDDCNGRSGVTPEYPNGTYYYVITDTFPFVPRFYRGTPDPSFNKGLDARPGGPGGRQGGQRGGQRAGQPQQAQPQGGGRAGRAGGPPPGMVPADALAELLGLTDTQKSQLERFSRVIDALNQENFIVQAFRQLKLTDDQMTSIAKGAPVRTVLTPAQILVLDANKRPGR